MQPSTRPCTASLLENALDHIELKIVDRQGKIVPFGEKGELCSRGYHVFKEYLHQPDRTAEVVRDGWYHTGYANTGAAIREPFSEHTCSCQTHAVGRSDQVIADPLPFSSIAISCAAATAPQRSL